jgi:hypothetical protein
MAEILLSAVSTPKAYNDWLECNRILTWLNQYLPIPHDLQRAVGQKIEPDTSRYSPVSLAMFLAVVWEERSFDNYFSRTNSEAPLLSLIHTSAPISRRPSSLHLSRGPMVLDTVSHTLLPPMHFPSSLSTHSLPLEGPIAHHPSSHLLRMLPEVVACPLLHPNRLPASVQNDFAEGNLSDDMGSA